MKNMMQDYDFVQNLQMLHRQQETLWEKHHDAYQKGDMKLADMYFKKVKGLERWVNRFCTEEKIA